MDSIHTSAHTVKALDTTRKRVYHYTSGTNAARMKAGTMTSKTEGLRWLSTPGHAYLVVTLDTATARRCSTGYDYAAGGAIYLEEDISAGVYIEAQKLTPDEWRNVPDCEGELPRNATRLEAGDLGAAKLSALGYAR